MQRSLEDGTEWPYRLVCYHCNRFGEAWLGIWQRQNLRTLQGVGWTVLIGEDQTGFVCDICRKSYRRDILEGRILNLSREPISAHELRQLRWRFWKSYREWPKPVAEVLEQAIESGIIVPSEVDCFPKAWKSHAVHVLHRAGVWLVPTEVASLSFLSHSDDWQSRERWLVSAAQSSHRRPLHRIVRRDVVEESDAKTPQVAPVVPDRVPGETSLDTLDSLSAKIRQKLGQYGITTIAKLCELSIADLVGFQYSSPGMVGRVQIQLQKLGWSLTFEESSGIAKSRFYGKPIGLDQEGKAIGVLGPVDYRLFHTIRFSDNDEERIDARNKLAMRHQKLSFKYAQLRASRLWSNDIMWSFEDVEQECHVALIWAIQLYDVAAGFRFATFAYRCMQMAFTKMSRESSALPAHLIEQVARILKAASVLRGELGRKPTHAEVGARLDLSEEKIDEALAQAALINQTNWMRLDAPTQIAKKGAVEEASTYGDLMSSPQNVQREIMQQAFADQVQAALSESSLLACDRWLVSAYWGLTGRMHTLEQLAEHLGQEVQVVRQRISQAHDELRSEEVWERIRWFFPGEQDKTYEEALPKYVQLERSIAGRMELAQLTDRERVVLRERMGIKGVKSKTLEEISQEYDVTRERIRQIENKALAILKLDRATRELIAGERQGKPKHSKEIIIPELGVEYLWPWDNIDIVTVTVADFYQIPLNRLWDTSALAYQDAQGLVCFLLRLRGWTAGQFYLELAWSNQEISKCTLQKRLQDFTQQFGQSAKIRRLVAALVEKINHRYQDTPQGD